MSETARLLVDRNVEAGPGIIAQPPGGESKLGNGTAVERRQHASGKLDRRREAVQSDAELRQQQRLDVRTVDLSDEIFEQVAQATENEIEIEARTVLDDRFERRLIGIEARSLQFVQNLRDLVS